MAQGAIHVDVRSPEEFAAGHLPGAKNVPLQTLPQAAGAIGPRSAEVVLYCRTGFRSSRAARLLKDAGFTRVHDLGAMRRW